jgi:hypothetical protein
MFAADTTACAHISDKLKANRQTRNNESNCGGTLRVREREEMSISALLHFSQQTTTFQLQKMKKLNPPWELGERE